MCDIRPHRTHRTLLESALRITASHIINWVDNHSKEAQANLPRWIRRLCFDPNATRQLSFPSGDSTFMPGWDGVLFSDQGNAWIPKGASRWEIGCDQTVTAKANREYRKRTKSTSDEERHSCTFVFVSPRRWKGKRKWIAAQEARNEWAEVRAYDADDLEQWLEQTPAVALQFGEELGLSGPGIESLSRYWQIWSQQCAPAITADALFVDRIKIRDELSAKLSEVSPSSSSLTIRAESVEEAVAFCTATAIHLSSIQDEAVVVTDETGWRYVDANPQLRLVIAANAEVATRPVSRPKLLVVIPQATGNWTGKTYSDELTLERPGIYEYEKALVSIGVEESDARRLALNTGRSWTVFRRTNAINPAIRHPAWLDTPQANCLTLLCLLGAWNSRKDADKAVVTDLANRSYEDIEQDLHALAAMDDAPLLKIGDVWKAKSPLELLGQIGNRITTGQLDRFFSIAKTILETPDPQLELPDEERWKAQVYGKIHLHSGLLFEAICDSLIKLAVRGVELPALQNLHIDGRVDRLIHDLFDTADEIRWLSLASHLPALAEAAPDAFLKAIEKSLRQANPPVLHLISETGSTTGFGGRCWHAGLLWALETLAWAPNRLTRVALILAQLSHEPVKGNWSNTPASSLFGLFRSWLPRTAAGLPARIATLDKLIAHYPDVAFDVLIALGSGGPQMAGPAAQPKWREDDAGAGHGVTVAEVQAMQIAARERIIRLSHHNASRIASLLEHNVLTHQDDMPEVLSLMEPFSTKQAIDEDRDLLRKALRRVIHWRRNYDDAPTEELDRWLKPVEEMYERLAPHDLIVRHRWLFGNHWPELPCDDRLNDSNAKIELVTRARIAALSEIFRAQGMPGIEHLIETSTEPGSIGNPLVQAVGNTFPWSQWIADFGGEFLPMEKHSWCISSLLGSPGFADNKVLSSVIELGKTNSWSSEKLARLLALAPIHTQTWTLAQECGPEVEMHYWQQVRPGYWRYDTELGHIVESLLQAKRPRTALHCCEFDLDKMSSGLLMDALQHLLAGEEADVNMIDSWHLDKMLQRLEASSEIDRATLIQLEFSLFPALSYGYEGSARALYEGVMSEPELFKELICLTFKPDHGEREELTEATQAKAHVGWKILHACKRQPGTQDNGKIDPAEFARFIESARNLCMTVDRIGSCDRALGQIFAHGPADEDGTWPFLPAREILDGSDMDEMRSGFYIGTCNKRGVTCRSPCDGGELERTLATSYRDQAERMQSTHPNVAAVLESLAIWYERDGAREDVNANLRKEGF